jgi:peroxiredoxin
VATLPARAQDLDQFLRSQAIRPVTPPTAATDFSLPDLVGGQAALSDFHGSWVLLTFFATWCGPCRSEMPSLDKLHRQHSGQGFEVVAVSVDSALEPVEPFVRQLGLTFPVLWDQRGEVGATYRASSIPVSYLIDPLGRIFGVARGARDWSRTTELINALLQAVPADSAAPPQYATGQQPVELPSDYEPPTAEVEVSTTTPQLGEEFEVVIRMHWAGSFSDYVPKAPTIHLPEAIERVHVSASTSSGEGRNLVTYRISLRAHETGSFALDPVEIPYTTRFDAETLTSRIADGPTVEVRPRTIAGLGPALLAAIVAAVLVAAVAVVMIIRRSRVRARAGLETDQPDWACLQARFDEARACRLQGDAAGSVLILAELERELGGGGEAAPVNLEELVEGARYGGRVPPADELDRLQRRVERRLAVLRPDPEQNERQAILLAEEDR